MDAIAPATKPGLWVLGTDTGVGKTRVSCLVLGALRRQHPGLRLAPFKPAATGCDWVDGGWSNQDAEALRIHSGTDLPHEVVCPLRYELPLAPAVAAQRLGGFGDGWDRLSGALSQLQASADFVVAEGVGGVLVPIDPGDTRTPPITALDLAARLGWPAVVVARPSLGTLNHTALTVGRLRGAGVPVLGVVVHAMPQGEAARAEDPSLEDNAAWLERLAGAPVLAVTPRLDPAPAPLASIEDDDPQLRVMADVDWLSLAAQGDGRGVSAES
ncbi:MAG: dethiobiotin synthase [Planctomycetota bacterium]